MKKKLMHIGAALIVCSGILFASCNNGGGTDTTSVNSDSMNTATPDKTMRQATAEVSGVVPDTTVSGTATFTSQPGGKVKLVLQLTIPSKANSSVAVHIHEGADCGEMGKGAGGHWNPTNEMHGKWGSEHFHSGDIGNVQLDAGGKGEMTLETDRWSIGGDSKTDILNRSIIVHGGADDYTSQPTGNAGSRIGCGVIKETGKM